MGIHLLRPGRDSVGIENGIERLPLLFLVTFSLMLVLNLIFKSLKRSYSFRKIVMAQHAVMFVAVLVFLAAFHFISANQLTRNIFFIWVSIINLWSISFAWDIVTDTFPGEDFTKQFGFIAFGGTLGCIGGYAISVLSNGLELYFSLVAFSICMWLIKQLLKPAKENKTAITGLSRPGIATTGHFLVNYGIMIFLYAIIATFLYFQQAQYVKSNPVSGENYKFIFAQLGLWINIIAMIMQLFFSSKIISSAGPLFPMALIPAVLIGGWLCYSISSSLILITVLMAFTKVASFSLIRPAREMLITNLRTTEKNKLKLFFDTVIYRGGDVAGSWLFVALIHAGISLRYISFFAIVFCLLWIAAVFQMRRYSLKPKNII